MEGSSPLPFPSFGEEGERVAASWQNSALGLMRANARMFRGDLSGFWILGLTIPRPLALGWD
jgi:hypothetical protein